MPCIPPFQEVMGPAHFAEQRARVDALRAEAVQFLPVLEAMLSEQVELAVRDDAQKCVSFLRGLVTEIAPTGGDPWNEGEWLKTFAQAIEVELCVAGTLAWLAPSTDSLAALRERHARHREADRQERLKDLAAQVAYFPVQAQEQMLRLNKRIAEIEALSVEAICRDRDAF